MVPVKNVVNPLTSVWASASLKGSAPVVATVEMVKVKLKVAPVKKAVMGSQETQVVSLQRDPVAADALARVACANKTPSAARWSGMKPAQVSANPLVVSVEAVARVAEKLTERGAPLVTSPGVTDVLAKLVSVNLTPSAAPTHGMTCASRNVPMIAADVPRRKLAPWVAAKSVPTPGVTVANAKSVSANRTTTVARSPGMKPVSVCAENAVLALETRAGPHLEMAVPL